MYEKDNFLCKSPEWDNLTKKSQILEIIQFHITIAEMYTPDSGSPYESA
jgi:hypothetical protein